MDRIAIIDGIRTPFCKMGTDFNEVSAQELGRLVTRELLERTGLDPKLIDEVIFGNVCQPADAANIARVISLLAGIPKTVPAFTVHRNCASGIESAAQAAIKIMAGEGSVYLVGGTEAMSFVPFFFSRKAQAFLTNLQKARSFSQKLVVLSGFSPAFLFAPQIGLSLGLTDPVCGLGMGQTAEVLAKEFGISRKEQDEFALVSHQRVIANRYALREEMMTVIPKPNFRKIVADDNGAREGQTMEALAKLKPFFDRVAGTVTAGNSSQITDGAAALIIMKESRAKELGYKPLGYMRSFAFAGVEPNRMGIGPAHAIPKALKKAGMKFKDIQSFEINEAFAAQVIACLKALASEKFAKDFGYEGCTGAIDPSILNVNGGAVALGHPVGTTGTRLILTMLKHMNRNNLNVGCVSLCIGGGQGAAVVLEK